ncbi:MAG TPA: hypothetical protein PK280_06025 [Planctomycetota bacterium]|nr:hypothetical protein [Planctomycetota bacterium]
MKRTWLSITGGILLVLLSLGTGLGGMSYVALSTPENMATMLKEYRRAIDEAEKSAPPDQRPQFEEARKLVADLEARTAGTGGEVWLASWRPFGYFELFASALGLVGGVALMIGGRFGRTSGLLAGVAGAAACVWGSMIGVPPPVSTGLQIACLLGYVVAILGAFSIVTEPQAEG